MISRTIVFTVTSYLAAAEVLLTVLEDARTTTKNYRVTGLTPESILQGGLVLEGEVDEISEKIAVISGATQHDS
jgi:hypothetical protein